ncbi:hypothetical protein BaRGS_00038322 [Batillaria attramentaria]|uniref:Uncharacterized protein n=1 Tax=Batillaria attramentaria TaxID=370345 RepID=A0ABD0J6R0_9CAEN
MPKGSISSTTTGSHMSRSVTTMDHHQNFTTTHNVCGGVCTDCSIRQATPVATIGIFASVIRPHLIAAIRRQTPEQLAARTLSQYFTLSRHAADTIHSNTLQRSLGSLAAAALLVMFRPTVPIYMHGFTPFVGVLTAFLTSWSMCSHHNHTKSCDSAHKASSIDLEHDSHTALRARGHRSYGRSVNKLCHRTVCPLVRRACFGSTTERSMLPCVTTRNLVVCAIIFCSRCASRYRLFLFSSSYADALPLLGRMI